MRSNIIGIFRRKEAPKGNERIEITNTFRTRGKGLEPFIIIVVKQGMQGKLKGMRLNGTHYMFALDDFPDRFFAIPATVWDQYFKVID